MVGGGKKVDHQFDFLCSLKHERFVELQRATGAFQGEDQLPNRNQLLDAFHLWCAESANAKYFLTMDDKLAKVVAKSKKVTPNVTLVRPRNLLAALIVARPSRLWSILKERIRMVRSKRDLAAPAQDASDYFFKGRSIR
jgi:hypothetical protein